MAVSADGKIDTVERRGARISGPADTVRVDRLRAGADAVMVGGRTLLGEDPRLTVRDAALIEQRTSEGRPPQPVKVGIVSRIGLPGDADALPAESLFLHDGGGRVFVCTTTRTDAGAIDWLRVQGSDVFVHGTQRVDLAETIPALHDAGVRRLMVEGGSTLVAALLAAGLVDEVQLAIAPLVFGGETAPTPVGGPGRLSDDAIQLSLAGVEQDADDDVILRYLVTRDA
jgi:2,5-diamino-6-(ribosylamino)-4(3H)-pyrimidinone 5'-phosphate reductase